MVRTERLGDIDQAVASQFEGEIREFVRRDNSMRRARPDMFVEEFNLGDKNAVEQIDTLIGKVSEKSMTEMERVISELQAMRDLLRREAERVRGELTAFAELSQTTMSSMKIIGDSLQQMKPAAAPPMQPEPRAFESKSFESKAFDSKAFDARSLDAKSDTKPIDSRALDGLPDTKPAGGKLADTKALPSL